jgi:S-adenosylmethionine hydrolase
LAWAAAAEGARAAFAIDPARGAWRRNASFEGLTLFAPVAAHLAAGAAPESVGPPTADWRRTEMKRPTACQHCIEGEVILHDRFGNAITNITYESLGSRPLARIEAAGRQALACSSYADLAASPGALGALWNSDGHLELFTYTASARDRAALARGTTVRAFPATP